MDFIRSKLNERELHKTLRSLKVNDSQAIDFVSNDYLGYAKDEQLLSIVQKELSKIKQLGSTGSRLITGNSYEAEDLELFLADFYEGETALFYPSGFMANLGFFSVLPSKSDTLIYDEYAHASLREAIRLNPCRSYAFKHNDPDDLEKKINRATGSVWVYIEGLYSMHGDYINPNDLKSVFERHHFQLIIDEAHSTGTIGECGKGFYSFLPKEMVFARLHTFGKALGYHGAVWIVKKEVKSYLINFSKPFIYSTALPKHDYIILKNIHQFHLKARENRLKRLRENIEYFSLKMNLSHRSPIIPIYHYNPKKMEEQLAQKGVLTKAIFPPTVPNHQQMLRIILHSFNSIEEIEILVRELNNFM